MWRCLTVAVVDNSPESGHRGTWHMADSFLSMKARKMAPRPRGENPRPSPLFRNHKHCWTTGIHYRTRGRANLSSFAHFPIKRKPLFPVETPTSRSYRAPCVKPVTIYLVIGLFLFGFVFRDLDDLSAQNNPQVWIHYRTHFHCVGTLRLVDHQSMSHFFCCILNHVHTDLRWLLKENQNAVLRLMTIFIVDWLHPPLYTSLLGFMF